MVYTELFSRKIDSMSHEWQGHWNHDVFTQLAYFALSSKKVKKLIVKKLSGFLALSNIEI